MPSAFKILVPSEQLEWRDEHGAYVWGPVWTEVGGFAFPAKGWADFVALVLSGWSEALTEGSRVRSVCLSFIDGPYHIDVNANAGQAELTFCKRTPNQVLRMGSASVAVFDLLCQVLEAGRTVLYTASDSGAVIDEISSLARETKRLEKLVEAFES